MAGPNFYTYAANDPVLYRDPSGRVPIPRDRIVQIVGKFFNKHMTRAFSVVRPFKATNAISGREREFKPGETLLSDPGQGDGNVTIEIEKSLFVVERSIFEACCKRKNDGATPFF